MDSSGGKIVCFFLMLSFSFSKVIAMCNSLYDHAASFVGGTQFGKIMTTTLAAVVVVPVMVCDGW